MSDYLENFKEKCKEIFKMHENESGCFIVNYREDAVICRDCPRKIKCSSVEKQLENLN